MVKNTLKQMHSGPHVDKSLIRMFLKMTPEERIQANDNAINTLSELKHAFRKQKSKNRKSGRPAERS